MKIMVGMAMTMGNGVKRQGMMLKKESPCSVAAV